MLFLNFIIIIDTSGKISNSLHLYFIYIYHFVIIDLIIIIHKSVTTLQLSNI